MNKSTQTGYMTRKEICQLYQCSPYILRKDLETCEDYQGSCVEKIFRNKLRYFNPQAVEWIKERLGTPQ